MPHNKALQLTAYRLAPGTFEWRSEAGGIEAMRYLVVVERSETGVSAYSPDIPGCVATGAAEAAAEESMREAIEFHLEGLREEGLPVPRPTSISAYVDVPA